MKCAVLLTAGALAVSICAAKAQDKRKNIKLSYWVPA
jgi:hypothetical protein